MLLKNEAKLFHAIDLQKSVPSVTVNSSIVPVDTFLSTFDVIFTHTSAVDDLSGSSDDNSVKKQYTKYS